MDQDEVRNSGHVMQPSAESSNVRNDSETFNVPNGSEVFRTVPKDSEGFRSDPQAAERTENHTLTVREVARMFESAGVARTERSVVNWCQPNRQGVARLDAYFDNNERKYYLTAESVERAIAEEKAKVTRTPEHSEPVGTVPKDEERETRHSSASDESHRTRDLEINNLVKNQIIEMKDKLIEQLEEKQNEYVERLIGAGRRIGELESKLLQLEAPKQSSSESANVPRQLEATEAL